MKFVLKKFKEEFCNYCFWSHFYSLLMTLFLFLRFSYSAPFMFFIIIFENGGFKIKIFFSFQIKNNNKMYKTNKNCYLLVCWFNGSLVNESSSLTLCPLVIMAASSYFNHRFLKS